MTTDTMPGEVARLRFFEPRQRNWEAAVKAGYKACYGDAAKFRVNRMAGLTECRDCDHFGYCEAVVSTLEQEVKTMGLACFGLLDIDAESIDGRCGACVKQGACGQFTYEKRVRKEELLRSFHSRLAPASPGPASPPKDSKVRDTAPMAAEPAPKGEEPLRAPSDSDATEPGYSFPTLEELFAHTTEAQALADDVLLQELERLALSFDQSGRGLPYQTVRLRLCAWSLEVNRRRLRAPAFRGLPPLRFHPALAMTDGQKLYRNDMQVWDLDWIARHFQSVRPGTPYAKLFNCGKLDVSLACLFAERGGDNDKKVGILRLDEWEQLLLAALRSESARHRWDTIRAGLDNCEQSVRAASLKPRSRMRKEDISSWSKVYVALRIARGSPLLARDIYRLSSGKAIEARTMGYKREWLMSRGVVVE